MTVLSAVQDACKLPSVNIYPAPTALFASTDQQEVQLCALANECAQFIAKAHDWRKLTTLKTQAGDGSTTSFALPDDYDRMPVKAQIFRTSTTRPMVMINDLDTWQLNRLQSISDPTGEAIILGGFLQIYPAMESTDSAKYYYQSNLIVDPASGSNKTAFTLDTDVFVLNERLLTLCLVWKYRSQGGLDYQQELQDYAMAMAQEIARDKGSRMIVLGRGRMPDGVATAYPGSITV
jgi:hypothetical protein